jgi:inorganic triphosphatase YgiF
MEIEAKYRVSAEDLGRVATLRQLGDYTLSPALTPEQQENTYYDTDDRRLTTARYGLRVRRVGARTLVTLKGPAEVRADAVHRRAEFEFPGSDPDPTHWAPGVARDLALALTGGADLTPTATVLTERHILHATLHGSLVAEICLDQGLLRREGHEQPFAEVEIELLPGGTTADLSALTGALQEHVQLVPELRTKLQRALELH